MVGLLNTYLPLTVIVFVINVKWFTASIMSAFVQVVGLPNTYLPLTVIVFVINVKWFTASKYHHYDHIAYGTVLDAAVRDRVADADS